MRLMKRTRIYIPEHLLNKLRKGAGLWKNKKVIPDLGKLRKELDRAP